MNKYAIFALVIMVVGLYQDFKKDKGLNKKAKIYHSILLTLLIWSFAGSFGYLGVLVRRFEDVQNKFGVDVGIFPGLVHLILFYLNLALGLAVLVISYQMINRKENARKKLILFIPLLAITQVFFFYKGWLSGGEIDFFNDYAILLIGAIIMGGAAFIYIKIYDSSFMRVFFSYQPVLEEEAASE